ncbi:MAG: hypothetical protein NWF09_00650 [Candidatus Bathyarchaeota archaeon]|nr:hypothetical protein [Candidatus Bathyarchaeota archaeon]
MVSSTIDHMVAVMAFLAATLLFIGLFNQTIQTGVIYQRHKALATKASDLLDTILLNPGIPANWSISDEEPTGFGLQDPEFTQYRLSPFALMRLNYSAGEPVYYEKTKMTYSNITMGFGSYLLMPYSEVLNYSTTLRLLGISGTYGFQLTITPLINVSITETQAKNPLRLSVTVFGTGFPLANAQVSYYLFLVSLSGGGAYPTYQVLNGTRYTNEQGFVSIEFPEVTDEKLCYAFIAYVQASGLRGVGYHQRGSSSNNYIIPFIGDLSGKMVLLAHSWDVHQFEPPVAEVTYNATLVVLTEDFTLREIQLENAFGKVNYGEGYLYGEIAIPNYNPGVLIVTYRKSAQEGGVVMMPWGLSSLGFNIIFGDDPSKQEWVSTDTRQVLVNGVAYQAKLALWSLEGYQVVS